MPAEQLNQTESTHTYNVHVQWSERKIMASNWTNHITTETNADTHRCYTKCEHIGLRQAQIISLDPFIIDSPLHSIHSQKRKF